MLRSSRTTVSIRASALATMLALAAASSAQAANAVRTLPISHPYLTGHVARRSSAKSFASGGNISIKQPNELALDLQGNLYVANTGNNDVVIYNPALVQQTAQTIANLAQPQGVAVDPYGNVYVSNFASSQINEYNQSGGIVRTVSAGLQNPSNIAVDSLDDLYVVNDNGSALSAFQKNGTLDYSAPFAPTQTSVAVLGSDLIVGLTNNAGTGTAAYEVLDASSLISQKIQGHFAVGLPAGSFVAGMAVDAAGGLWFVDQVHHTIVHATFNGEALTSEVTFKTIHYVPSGIAVDSARNRIYVSDFSDSQIHVINMQSGALMAVIR